MLGMGADSACLGFSVFLKKELFGLDMHYKRRSEIYMNCLLVHLCQIFMNYIVFSYATATTIWNCREPAQYYGIYIARFVASIWTHVFVEKDIQQGINMMKYVVNHYKNFENPYAAFLFGFMTFAISLHVEINAMINF